MSKLTAEKEAALEKAFKDPFTGLGGTMALYRKVKDEIKNLTFKNVKDFMDEQEVNQVVKGRSKTKNSYVATAPLEQFQIDLIYMPNSWWNNGYKYVFDCIDVFSKKAEMIPLKVRDKETVAIAFEKILENMGIPKTIYSDMGSEFDNKEFQKILNKHNIKIIFAIDHAPFIESFNKTMKNRLYKYMALHRTDNWSKAMEKVLEGYNNTPHSATGIAPNEIDDENSGTAYLKMMEKKKITKYPKIHIGETVRIPVTHKVEKGYKQQWSYELHIVEDVGNDGVYQVNGYFYPRKELQLVKGDVKKRAQLSEIQMKNKKQRDNIGKAQNIVEIKNLTGKIDRKQAAALFEPLMTKSQKKAKEAAALAQQQKRTDVDTTNILEGKRERRPARPFF